MNPDEGNEESFNLLDSASEAQKEVRSFFICSHLISQFIARAFANDDVDADFAKEKAYDEDEELPDEVKSTAIMPGWGTWGGDGSYIFLAFPPSLRF